MLSSAAQKYLVAVQGQCSYINAFTCMGQF